MSISSHQHRFLRRGIVVAFIIILLISLSAWFLVSRHFKDSSYELVKANNQIVALAIGDVFLATDKKFVARFSQLSAQQRTKSKHYLNIQAKAKEFLHRFKLLNISIINRGGVTIFSTMSEAVGKKNNQQGFVKNALHGNGYSLSIETHAAADLNAVSVNSIISFVPLQTPGGKILAVLKLVSDTTALNESITHIKYYILTGVIIGLSILLVMFFYIAKYSDSLVNKYAKQIVTQAKSDPVTGLLNRHHFFRYIRRDIKKAIQQNARVALMIIDIDHFKELNAKYDHSFGDEVLKILVNRLTRILEATDTIARTGDDEFSILIAQSGSNSDIRDFAKKILAKVNEPIQIDANYIHLTCSIGISIINQDAKEIQELVQHADSALYNAKDFGRNNFQIFSRGGAVRHIKFYERQYALNKALEENEYILHIQPKVNAETGDIVGGEALLRWDNPDYGIVQPLEFLPALEKSGLIHNVGKWVLNESCRLCKQFNEQTGKAIPISVNISALQFKNEDFINIVSESLRASKLDGSMLEIELTETCLMDNVEYSLHILAVLKKMGIRIAIDDFGTGYSSLNYLKRFPIDVLKIDRSFIADVHDRKKNDNAAIVTAIMALSHSLHLEAVAEGVELAEELAYLNALGCKIIQGFLFSDAVSVDKYLELLQDNKKIVDRLEKARQQLA